MGGARRSRSFAGRPKIGKSWLALDWSIAVARGGFCFGDIHCQEGDVLYLALEDNKRRLKFRLAKILGFTCEWPEKFEYATEWPRANEGGEPRFDWASSTACATAPPPRSARKSPTRSASIEIVLEVGATIWLRALLAICAAL